MPTCSIQEVISSIAALIINSSGNRDEGDWAFLCAAHQKCADTCLLQQFGCGTHLTVPTDRAQLGAASSNLTG